MMRRDRIWRPTRMTALAAVLAVAAGMALGTPAEARDGHWQWNGGAYVWVYESYPPAYYAPPAYYYPSPYYYGYGPGYYPGYYYGPSVSFGVRYHNDR